MFSWSKKKDSKKRGKGERSSEENEFGIKLDQGPTDKQLEAELRKLAGVQDLPEDDFQLNDGEEDVESELLRLMGGKGKKPAKKQITSNDDDGPTIDIMADITAEIDLGDEDVDVDENDPDLLGELLELTQEDGESLENKLESESESEPEADGKPSNGEGGILTVLKERLKMYKTAEEKAKGNNETSRARRFGRGIKTIEDLIKKAKAGRAVNETEIPPEIAMNLKPAPPPPSEPQLPITEANDEDEENLNNSVEESSNGFAHPPKDIKVQSSDASQESGDVVTTLVERLKMYQIAESKAKEGGETTRARRFNRGIKTIEELLKQAKTGKPILPNEIPPKVALNLKPAPPVPLKQPDEENSESEVEEDEEEEGNEEDSNNLPGNEEVKESQDPERNVMEVLSERLEMYKAAEAKAKEMGEGTRARRFLRGIKTIQDLIKQANAGNTISVQDIPPAVALNLKPAPPLPPMPQPVVAIGEEENNFTEQPIERDDLRQASDNVPTPIKFSPANDDDIDLDDELLDLEVPETVMEGLEQRIQIYKKLMAKAKAEADVTAEKLYGENIRLYLNAIKTFKSGGYIDVLKLPAPKGAPPIPIPFYFN